MIKASQQISFIKPTGYIEAEWVGSANEAFGLPMTGVPNFIGNPQRIIPRSISPDEIDIVDAYHAFFKVDTNLPYHIISSMPKIGNKLYPKKVTRTRFLNVETLIFVNETTKQLKKIPTLFEEIRWSGTPPDESLGIDFRHNRIILSQPATGSMLLRYYTESDVWVNPSHIKEGSEGYLPLPNPVIFGIFTDDGSAATSLRLDPRGE